MSVKFHKEWAEETFPNVSTVGDNACVMRYVPSCILLNTAFTFSTSARNINAGISVLMAFPSFKVTHFEYMSIIFTVTFSMINS